MNLSYHLGIKRMQLNVIYFVLKIVDEYNICQSTCFGLLNESWFFSYLITEIVLAFLQYGFVCSKQFFFAVFRSFVFQKKLFFFFFSRLLYIATQIILPRSKQLILNLVSCLRI